MDTTAKGYRTIITIFGGRTGLGNRVIKMIVDGALNMSLTSQKNSKVEDYVVVMLGVRHSKRTGIWDHTLKI